MVFFISALSVRRESSLNGHFDIIQDGKVIPVCSENQNCFYTAVAQATTSNRTEDEIKREAVNLRNNVKDQIKGNLHAHSEMIQTQRAYDALERNHGKYALVGGFRPIAQRSDEGEYEDDISPMKSNRYGSSSSWLTEYDIDYKYHLGLVGPYKRVKNTRLFSHDNKGLVEADHIPPKGSLQLVRNHTQIKNLQQKNPKLYDMINSIGSDQNGENLLTVRALKQHHRAALTTGTSKEKAQGYIGMSAEGTVSYYKAGFNQMLNHHNEKGIIDQNQLERLKSWVVDDKYLDQNTPEYIDILTDIK
ncbi:unnamed protein product [Coregonus sp. 'balchen']|nr:unnamed protein product [Coregonus sp. 'balchen']